jgi:hypothetical protein
MVRQGNLHTEVMVRTDLRDEDALQAITEDVSEELEITYGPHAYRA